MKLHDYLEQLPPGGKAEFARSVSVSPAYLYQIASGMRPVPPERCRAFSAATGGAVSVCELRPDIFGDADQEPSVCHG